MEDESLEKVSMPEEMQDRNGTWRRAVARLLGGHAVECAMKVAATVFLVVVTWRIANAQISINWSDLRFSDLLALILALFAMGLSAAFYLQSTKMSHTFYDNTYRFTKDTSEMLGRIEAGFGERLRHIDEGYTGLVSKIDNLPADWTAKREEIKKEKADIEETAKERDKVITEALERANVQVEERDALLKLMKEKDLRLLAARDQLRRLQEEEQRLREMNDQLKRISTMAGDREPELSHDRLLLRRLRSQLGKVDIEFLRRGGDNVENAFGHVMSRLPEDLVEMMVDLGWMDRRGHLTSKGEAGMAKVVRGRP